MNTLSSSWGRRGGGGGGGGGLIFRGLIIGGLFANEIGGADYFHLISVPDKFQW